MERQATSFAWLIKALWRQIPDRMVYESYIVEYLTANSIIEEKRGFHNEFPRGSWEYLQKDREGYHFLWHQTHLGIGV